MNKVVVTGGLGQIGSHVVELLLARGDKVVAVDNLATGRKEHLTEHPNLTVVLGSIADKAMVDGLFADFKPDAVVHTAASYKDPNDWYNDTLTNVVGGSNVIFAAKENKVGRFVYFQTALCYGVKPLQQPIRLDHPKFPANSSYAITKTANEDFLAISGLDFVTFRLANVVGPRNVSGPLPIFFQRLRDGKKCFCTKARRDFVFVKDLARYTVKAVDGTGNGTYHFSSGTDIAITTLYDEVVKAMKLNTYPEPDIRDLGPDDAPSILLDPSRTFADFGEIEFTPLSQTVQAAVDYYQDFGVHGEYTHLAHEKK
ncbi:NAD-dependent epimerase/dehydratase family protein [uncultured Hyphomicrobium sp.]|uniref:NAD-dependent epimerase/dehydratase family protein n=1 Tax=uncultured Hyphomicrobium sp. TaxID=194373 RepID=UPI0025E5E566|nr:NAD-dependent epimerase/dehydratase family protein [uncultured Hyphomicrobium sp.]